MRQFDGVELGTAFDARWQFALILEIRNFPMLRRRLGIERSQTLTAEVSDGLTGSYGYSNIRIRGHDQIEIWFEEAGRARLDSVIADCLNSLPELRSRGANGLMIELNIGAAFAGAETCDCVRLIEEAERALVDSRSKRVPVVRDVSKTVFELDPVSLTRDLPFAVERNEFFLNYQPKLSIRKQEVASIEALIRWNHPRHGTLMPNDFIPIAEQTSVMASVTLWTINRAILDYRALRDRDLNIRIFINIAGILLTDSEFVQAACEAVINAEAHLGFEVTETSMICDPQAAIHNLHAFASIGITISIDDYGAGLSSLAYLKQLPARELKIDKLFVTQLTSSHRDPLIVRSTIDLAHALEMSVVAEGVEDPAALALLSVMGCDMVQGYLISKPIDIGLLIEFLEERKFASMIDRRTMIPWSIVKVGT